MRRKSRGAHLARHLRRPRPAATDRTLMSPTTSAAVDSAFNALAQTVLVQNARTLEDLVKEMLRPMLKSWLDDNLPSVVERIVKAEIERVSRGPRLNARRRAAAGASRTTTPAPAAASR